MQSQVTAMKQNVKRSAYKSHGAWNVFQRVLLTHCLSIGHHTHRSNNRLTINSQVYSQPDLEVTHMSKHR